MVLKINYDDHINREVYKVPSMNNLLNMTVMRARARQEAQTGVEKKNKLHTSRNTSWGFPGGSVVKSLPANAGDAGLGRSHTLRSN